MNFDRAIQLETLAIALYESEARYQREITRSDQSMRSWFLVELDTRERYRNKALDIIQKECL